MGNMWEFTQGHFYPGDSWGKEIKTKHPKTKCKTKEKRENIKVVVEKKQTAIKVPFFCPCCGKNSEAELSQGILYAEPDNRVCIIKCGIDYCGKRWRIELFDCEEDK